MIEEYGQVKGQWVYTGSYGSLEALFTAHPLAALWLRANGAVKEIEWQAGRKRVRITRQDGN